MSFIRPAVRARISRWQEVIAAGALAIVGLWFTVLGGWLFVPLGLIAMIIAVGWAVIAYRRSRFRRGVSAPGVVEVDEGQIGYFGPTFGGFIALDDLVELRLMQIRNSGQWRLKTRSNEVLLIPTAASGAERLFDAFAALPDIDMAALTTALDRGTSTLPLWRRGAARTPRPRLDHEL